jgi:predicted RNA-binding protein Jag
LKVNRGRSIQSAAAYFGVKRDRLKIEVLCEEEKGLFGKHGVTGEDPCSQELELYVASEE